MLIALLLALIPVMVVNIGMILGGVTWLAFELAGVWNKYHGVSKPDTTSQWTWILLKHWPILRPVLGVFLISLFFHLLYGWWLLP